MSDKQNSPQANEQIQPLTEEEAQAWVREHFQAANAYLVQKGLLTDRILTKESRYLIPHVALWKFSLQGLTEKVWVINGAGLPMDHIESKLAKTPQDVLRYFSYRWQIKADNILHSAANITEKEQEYAQVLIQSAEKMFVLGEDERFWQSEA